MTPAANHLRNVEAMQRARRCGARTRLGGACQSPAISGKARCRMHGGKGSGAPKGNHNALRHGAYTKEVSARAVRVRDLCQRLRALTVELSSNNPARKPIEAPSKPGKQEE